MSNTTIPYAGPKTPRSKRWMLYLLAAIGVLAAVLLREPVVSLFRGKTPDPPPVQLKRPPEARREAVERAKPHLDWADAEAQRLVDEQLRSLDVFFGDVKKRTPRFAEDVLSWGSKWRLVADKLPYTRPDRHQEFLRERFGARLFTPDHLAQAVEFVVKSYVDSVLSTEGVMLVKIKADIQDLPQATLPQFATKDAMERAFQIAIEEAAQKAQVDLRSDVIRELASTIAGEVMAMVAVRLGVSAGILSAGAGTSWATLGVGMVVGLIVDQIVSWVWNWWTDPVGDLTKMMNEKLDHIHSLIVNGDGTKPGLRAKLLELHDRRKLVRWQALNNMIERTVQP